MIHMSKKITILAMISLLLIGCPKYYAQVPVALGQVPKFREVSNTGAPLAGGRVFTYQAGTAIALATYSDYLGTVQNPNPTILDSAGRANIWFQVAAYKIVVQNSAGVQIYSVDGFTPPPSLTANNSWTGNQIFSGSSTFNGTVSLNAGGAMSGTFSGNPTFTGTVTFSGATFSGNPLFSTGLKTDTISGTLTNGGNMVMTGANGAAGNLGETIFITSGAGASNFAGGTLNLTAGAGTGTGAGGAAALKGGSATGGAASAGGTASLQGGSGFGAAGAGGTALILGGNSAGGPGGGVIISSGSGTGAPGDIIFSNAADGFSTSKVVFDDNISTSGKGVQFFRTSTGSIGATTRAEVLVTWPQAFANANYTPICNVQDSATAAATQGLTVERVKTISTTQVGIIINNPTGGALTGQVYCIGFLGS